MSIKDRLVSLADPDARPIRKFSQYRPGCSVASIAHQERAAGAVQPVISVHAFNPEGI
jgi:hypothetical protein